MSIRARPQTVFALAEDVLRWPELLSHYRYVRPVGDGHTHGIPGARQVKMAARRGIIPVSWSSIQEPRPERLEVHYLHIGGVTKNMRVVWRLQPTPGGTEVTIEHELDSPRWWLRNPIGRHVVGRWFVVPIANRTLAGIKQQAEAGT